MSQKIKIAPSILSADFSNLETEIKAISNSGADYIHIDVMDGEGFMSIFSSSTLPFGKCTIPSLLTRSPAFEGSEAPRPATVGR